MPEARQGEVIATLAFDLAPGGSSGEGRTIARPVLLLIADAGGYSHLSKLLRRLASRATNETEYDNHVHVAPDSLPFNPELSGDWECRLVMINPSIRGDVLQRYGLKAEGYHQNGLIQWFASLIKNADAAIQESPD